jgi:hypothetical protein
VDVRFDSGIVISGRVGADPARSGPMPEVFRSGGTSAIRERGSSRRTPTVTRSRSAAAPPARKTPAGRVERVILADGAEQALFRFGLTDGLVDMAILVEGGALETGGAILGRQSGTDFILTEFLEDTTLKRSPTSVRGNLKQMSAAADALIGDWHSHPRLASSRREQEYSGTDAENWRNMAEEFGKREWLGMIVAPTQTEWGQTAESREAWKSLSFYAYTCTRDGQVTPVPIVSV